MKPRKRLSTYFFAIRVAICLSSASFVAYAYIDQRNSLTELQRIIPQIEKEARQVQDENVSLQYEIDCFRNPRHLLELLREPQYRYLQFPSSNEVIALRRSGDESKS